MEKDAEILLNIETNEKLDEISKNTEASLISQDETKEAIKELQPALDATLIQSIENTEKIVEAVEKSSNVSIEIKGADLIKYKGEKGEKGDKGDKGDDGKTPTDEELVALIEPLIPEPIKGEDGQDYILTEEDKKEIAQSIEVPIVEKIIEKTEVIRETPITIDKTKTVVKEVAKYETAKELAKKLNTLTKEIDFKVIKNFPDFSKNGGSGLNTVFTDGTTILGNGLADNPLRAVGGGGGAVDSVNGQTGVVVLDADDIDDTSTTNKFVTSADLTKLSNLSGTNTGDQTSIVGITGTKAEFDTAVTDGNFLYVGDITQYTDEMAQDAVGGILTNSTFINLTYSDATPSITASLNATGTPSSSTYLRGDNTWATIGGGGDVTKVGTPVNNQIGVWTGDGTIEGTTGLTYDGANFQLTGDIGSTGTRITKGWFTDLQVTNAIAGSITGNAATVTTNANLTGVVTSVGNATAIADAALSIAKTSGLQTALDGKQATITFGTGVQTALGVNIGSAGAPVLFNGAGGTPSSLTGTNITGTASGLTAGAVTNATLTTALTVNTGTVTLIGNVANTSVLTIGAGAVSVSGSNTGDQTTISGNAGTATTLQNTRTIWGQNFNGSANVTGTLALGTADLTLTGSIGATGARATKVWATDLEITNMPTVGGTSLTTVSQTFQNKTLTNSNNVLGGVTMTLGSDANGDTYYRASSVLTRVPKGTAGQVYTMNTGATAPEWRTPTGTVFSLPKSTASVFSTVVINFGETAYGDTTAFLDVGDESGFGIIAPRSGILKNLYIGFTANSLDASIVFTLRINGADTSITATRTSGSTVTISDTTNTASVSAGDILTIKGVVAGSSGSATPFYSFELQ